MAFNTGDKVQIHEWNCEIQDPLRISISANSQLYTCKIDSIPYPLFLKYFNTQGLNTSKVAQNAYAVWQRVREHLVAAGSPDILWCDDNFQLSQFIEGDDVNKLHISMTGLSIPQIHAIVRHIADKVDILMQQHVVHGDVKPENTMTMLEDPGTIPSDVHLIDFDLMNTNESLTFMSGELVMGSPAFMPPEQIIGNYRPTTDVFALGMTALELLANPKNNLSYYDVVQHCWDINDFISQRAYGTWLKRDARLQLEKALVYREGIDVSKARQLIEFFFMATKNNPDARPQNGKEMRQILIDTGNITEV